MPQHPFTDFWKLPKELVKYNENNMGLIDTLVTICTPQNHVDGILYGWQDSHLSALARKNGMEVGKLIFDERCNIISGIHEEPDKLSTSVNLDSVVWNLQKEEYMELGFDQKLWSFMREIYYTIKPLLSRSVQIRIRKSLVSRMAKRNFPRWPIDTSTEIIHFGILKQILKTIGHSLPMISFWPNGAGFCLVLTHDIDTQIGFNNLHRLLEIERRCGFRSSWNFVPRRYKIDQTVLNKLRMDGFEIGVHGLYHDGKYFDSYNTFQGRAQLINSYLREWGSVGFRAPSAVRKLEWISNLLDIEYDTSCPTSEIYGAQPGGCCTTFPFFCNSIVELPFTMPEDHTLLEILDFSPDQMVNKWLEVVEIIKNIHGMALLIVHPDYILTQERLSFYENFLQIMKQETNCWFALPHEVAKWWRERNASELIQIDGKWVIRGPAADSGEIMMVSVEQDQLTFSPYTA